MQQLTLTQMKIRKDYIKKLIKLKSLKQKEAASLIGVSTQDWNNWMFRGVFPHYNKLEELATLLEVKPEELIDESEFNDPLQEYENGSQFLMTDGVPYFDLDTSSAIEVLTGNKDNISPTDFTYIPGLSADFILSCYGKEMIPVISNGDLIALRKITDHSFFNFGNIYLIATQEQILIRYVKSGERRGYISLFAENETHETIDLPLSKVKAIYLVVCTIKRQVI